MGSFYIGLLESPNNWVANRGFEQPTGDLNSQPGIWTANRGFEQPTGDLNSQPGIWTLLI